MARDEIHNEVGGRVAGNVFQAGAVHGDVLLLPRSSGPVQPDESQALLVRHLADEVHALSSQEVRHRGISGTGALSVRWHAAAGDLFDHWENIDGETDADGTSSLAGRFTLIKETYRAVRSRRLVILGRAGAGKTVLAHRLILDLIVDAELGGPVPVLFRLGGWSPESTGLRRWMADRLVGDFPFLGNAGITGKRAADLLVDNDRILPVLDGFDELPDRHHRTAIDEISRVDWPLVVTSRRDEYAKAAHAARAVGSAAAIELADIALDEAERYLHLSAGKSRAADWDEVFARLRAAPEHCASRRLGSVLTTSLMVSLARATYNDTPERHPGELLDTCRFRTSTDLEEHLLAAHLAALYDPRRPTGVRGTAPWDADRARRWLGHLAVHLTLRGTQDLIWWQLPATVPWHIRVLHTTAAIGATYGSVVGLVYAAGTGGALVNFGFGFGYGLVIGLTVGLVNEVKFSRTDAGREPGRLRPRLRARSGRLGVRLRLRRSASEFADGLTAGLVFGLVFGITGGPALGVAVGLTSGLLFGATGAAMSMLGDTPDPRDAVNPWQLLDTDRTATVVPALVAGVVFGLVFGLVDGVANAIAAGLMAVVVRVCFSAWGSWLLFARLWLPLTGRLPWRPKRFLEDAYRRGVLRQAGAVYQFRHVRLRDHLAHHRAVPTARPAAGSAPSG